MYNSILLESKMKKWGQEQEGVDRSHEVQEKHECLFRGCEWKAGSRLPHQNPNLCLAKMTSELPILIPEARAA